MKAIIQRVNGVKLEIDGRLVSQISNGLLVFIGIHVNDCERDAEYLAKKISGLRIFKDQNDKLNLSVKDIDGSVLIVSNFTIYGDCSRGNRPNFQYSMSGEKAKYLYECFIKEFKMYQIKTQTGVFGAHMHVLTENDGPINIIIES